MKLMSENDLRQYSYEREKMYNKHRNDTRSEAEKYNTRCIISNILWFIIPFLITTMIVIDKTKSVAAGFMFGIIPGGIFGIIGYAISTSINVKDAVDYDLPDNHPLVENEKLKHKTAIASGIIAGASTYKHTKRAAKDVMNVDGWKEMK